MIAQPEKQKTDEGQSHSQNTETKQKISHFTEILCL